MKGNITEIVMLARDDAENFAPEYLGERTGECISHLPDTSVTTEAVFKQQENKNSKSSPQ